MGLNPGFSVSNRLSEVRADILSKSFNSGSPYHAMFKCGCFGIPLDECVAKCNRNGIPLRKKDITNYNNGLFRYNMQIVMQTNIEHVPRGMVVDDMKLEDFPMLPHGWVGTEKRFFPCTQDNRPMQKWGWSKEKDGSIFKPQLYTRPDAKALSPCGWVGQNLLYQRFIVIDIDGRGHGEDDESTIMFGNIFKDNTFSTEDPKKLGSFHLYFETDRLIPVRHFPWAKIDLMGNAVNAAVYFKNKVGNGMPMMKLDQNIWRSIMVYQKKRKETQDVS